MDAKLKYRAKKIKLVCFDIDDTLRVKDTGYIPDSIQHVFAQLKKKGILTAIATGRAMYGVVPELMALEPDFFVTINGSYVVDKKGNIIHERPIPAHLAKVYIDWSRESGFDYGMMGAKEAVLSRRDERISDVIDIIYPDLPVRPDFYKEEAVYQIWTFEPEGIEQTVPSHLAEELRSVRWHDISSDIILTDASKAAGVAKLVNYLGLKPENVMAFGDGLNDVELFDYAGISIAMGHSHPELLTKADYVTKKLEEDGIAYALETVGMIEPIRTYPQTNLDQVEGPVATIKTNYGDMVIQLFPEQAPKTVANFVGLAKSGYYDGVIFHRIIKDFMIQGGDPTGTGMGGQSIYGASFEDEFSLEVFNIRGALSMANAGPNTNGSQFFIVQNKNFPYPKKELERAGFPEPIIDAYVANGGTPHLDQRHTVFGHLKNEASYAVLDAIASVATGAADKPVDDVIIETVIIED